MLGDFSFCNPTKLYFGEHALEHLPEELKKYGSNVVLTYGGGSIKKNGIYDDVMKVLKETGKNVTEISGIMPNPTVAKLNEGIKIARDAKVNLILAVGGGSVIDYSKALSVSVNYDGDPWEKYYLRFEEPDCETIPVGAVLTMVGTGSEMNAGAVITNPEQKLKIGHVFKDEKIMPRFAILNPRYTMTLPHYQMVSGIYDIFNHICEQYFSGTDDNTSDYIAEGLMRSVIHSGRIANKDPKNYEARSNLMWTATWALNTLIEKGKTTDWMVHMLGQAVGAVTNATHGMTLAAVSLPYYRHIMPYGLPKFVRFAENVWNINPEAKTDEEVAKAGLDAMEKWMKELGLVMNITDLGANESMIPDLVKGTIILKGGYKVLDEREIAQIFKESLS
jgi:alcohol dehydrogenase YqhD (iron-dependent ADH family)